ncbi:putative retrotransposon ty1-copia subclass protein [Tanacetum coccineum]
MNGSNFLDWYRNQRIVLKNKQKLHHLDEALPEAPHATTTADVRNAYTRMVVEQQEVAFHAFKWEEGQSVSTYMLKIKGYMDQMKRLFYLMPLVLGLNLLLTSLSKDYDQCVQNYNMHGMWKSIPELHAMLKLAKKGMPKKALAVLTIRQAHIQKPKLQARGKGKNKGKKAWTLEEELSTLLGSLDMYVGNGNRAAVEAIGSFDLILLSGMQHQLEAEHDDVEPQTDINLVHRSVSIPQAHERYGYYVDAEEHKLEDHGEPTNYRFAFSDPKFDKWLEAMNVEIQSMKDNQVWNLVDLPPNYKIVGSKWLFKKKTDMDGNKHTYKARLVAKGFTQTYGVNN